MNTDSFTRKTKEAVADTPPLRVGFNRSQIEPEHISAAAEREPRPQTLAETEQALREDVWRDEGGQG